MKEFVLNIYRFIFCRKLFYGINLHIYKLSLRGIGVLNTGTPKVTGEKYLLESLLPKLNIKTVIDVGANDGGHALLLKKHLPKTKIYACEPHPETFLKLKENTKDEDVKIFNLGFLNKETKGKLWDFAEDAKLKHTQPTSTLASLHRDVIEDLYGQKSQYYNVQLTTIDKFAKKHKIDNIDFLKIDTEGSEYQVLRGAANMLSRNKIGIILFEFNEMNVCGRVFFKDFFDLLSNYKLYRLMPNGLFPIRNYSAKIHEIFAFQNIVAFNEVNALHYP